VNKPLSKEQKAKLFLNRKEQQIIEAKKEKKYSSEQDRYLYWLCRPERLLTIIKILFCLKVVLRSRSSTVFCHKQIIKTN
jgi:hypothetical protein